MAKKRGNSEGSIHQLPSGSWRAQITLQGHRLGYTAKTRRETQEWLKQITSKVDNGLTYTYLRMNLEEYMNEWLVSIKSVVKYGTFVQYAQISRDYILPWLGKIKVTELRTDHIQRIYNQLQEQEDVGIYAIRKTHTVLHAAFEHALKIGIISRNPVTFAQQPRLPIKEMTILDESQVSQLLVTASGYRLGALIHLAVVTGARQMELLGLKWTDIDWIKKTLHVERQLEKTFRTGNLFTSTKTRYGKRTIELGGNTISLLREHMNDQQGERIAAEDQWQENGLIFSTTLGTPIDPSNLRRDFKKILVEAGLPEIRFHDLRHTAASLLLIKNISPIVVSRRLGHSKPSITLDVYGHYVQSMQSEAAELIDEMVTPVAVDIKQLEFGTPKHQS